MQYKSLDIFKCIAAIMVVAIHTQLLCEYEVGYFVRCLCRIAVPFFFVCSSFLFYRRKGSIVKYTKRILLLYLVWLVICMPYVYTTFFKNSINLLNSVIAFFHGLLFHNTFHASWYLMASVIGMNLVYYLSRIISNKGLLLIGVLLYVSSLLSCSYNGLIERTCFNTYYVLFDRAFVPSNSFIISIIYIVIGKVLAEKDTTISERKSLFFTLCFALIGVVEIAITKGWTRYSDAFVFLPLFSFFFFQFLLNISDRIKISDRVCLTMRRSSILIYLFHYICIDFHLSHGMLLGTPLFLVVVIEAMAFATLVVILSNRIQFLKYLY